MKPNDITLVMNDMDDDGMPTTSSSNYHHKSLFELERDTDRILEDIRNIGNDSSNNDNSHDTISNKKYTSTKNSSHKDIHRTKSSQSLNGVRIRRTSTDDTTSVVSSSSSDTNHVDGDTDNDDDDDEDSIIGELQRLESVTTTIRLSLIDTTNEASLRAYHHNTTWKHSAGGGGGTIMSPPNTTTSTTMRNTTTTTTTTNHYNEPSRPIATKTTTTTAKQTTTNRTMAGSGRNYTIMHGTNNNCRQMMDNRIRQRSMSISIVCIMCIWIALWYMVRGGDTTSSGFTFFSSSSLLTINDQGVIALWCMNPNQ